MKRFFFLTMFGFWRKHDTVASSALQSWTTFFFFFKHFNESTNAAVFRCMCMLVCQLQCAWIEQIEEIIRGNTDLLHGKGMELLTHEACWSYKHQWTAPYELTVFFYFLFKFLEEDIYLNIHVHVLVFNYFPILTNKTLHVAMQGRNY